MRVRANIGILLLCLYSLVLGLSNSLHVSMLLPLVFELFRHKNSIFTILKKLIMLNLFITILALSVYFSNPKLALLIFLRSNMVVAFGLLLFHKQNYFDIAYGLKLLKIPSKMVLLFYFCGKFIYLLSNEIKIFKKNLLLRGFHPKVTLFTYKTYANFIGLLFIQAFHRANTLNNILITRGFHGEIYSLAKPKKINFYEILLSLITIFSLIFQKGVLI